jgi:hypothetical protein
MPNTATLYKNSGSTQGRCPVIGTVKTGFPMTEAKKKILCIEDDQATAASIAEEYNSSRSPEQPIASRASAVQ